MTKENEKLIRFCEVSITLYMKKYKRAFLVC